MATECIACKEEGEFTYQSKYPLCKFHYKDILDDELVDNLAREIYIEDWLIPNKKKSGEGSKTVLQT